MKRALKNAAVILLVLALAPVAAFVGYELMVFQPKRGEITALLAAADPQDRNPPPLIRRYLIVANEPTTRMATRYLGDRLGITTHQETRRPWPDLLMQALIRLHLSEDDILGLYASLVYTGQGQYGLNSLSQRLFNKPLSDVSEPEAATIVAVLWAPQRMLSERARLEKRRDALLRRAQKR